MRGRHVRKSSNCPLKSIAIEELRAKEKLTKGIAPESGRGLKYEDIRASLIADYTDKGKIEMVDGEMLISGRGGRLKALDDYFLGMPVRHITTDVIRDFKAERKAEGVCGPSVNRNLAALRRMFNLARREKLAVRRSLLPNARREQARQAVSSPETLRQKSLGFGANLAQTTEANNRVYL